MRRLGDRATQLALAYRRTRLLAPLAALEQISGTLLHRVTHTAVKGDLGRIHTASEALLVVVGDILALAGRLPLEGILKQLLPGTVAGPSLEGRLPSAAERIDHLLASKLSIVSGFARELIEHGAKEHTDPITEDIERLGQLAAEARDLGARLVLFLQGEDATEAGEVIDWARVASMISPSGMDHHPGHVLVIDHDSLLRELLARRLRSFGHQTSEADGVDTALRAIRAPGSPVELVLVELILPDRNGVDLLRELRTDPSTRLLPVLIVSAADDPAARVCCLESGADDFLSKPPDSVLRARVGASLEAYRDRSRFHKVLYDTFPRPIAELLRKGNPPPPKDVEDVAVLFADIKGFTAYSDKHRKNPRLVVNTLAKLFPAWDQIARMNKVQKIKTIGDGYMGVSGLFGETGDLVLNCVSCGLEMIEEVTRSSPADEAWKLRVGIHVGPVVAGLLGETQYLYDVWGDTVNTASRVESNGRANCVNLSSRAYQRIAGEVPGADHSHVTVKGKEIEMIIYHVDLDLAPTVKIALSRHTR